MMAQPTSRSAPGRLTRRQFVAHSLGLAGAVHLPWVTAGKVLAQSPPKWRAAIIGHTGHGDYGHNLERIFNRRPGITVVALADPDAKGRAEAAARAEALRTYADYHEMLEKEKPQLVCVAPRWTDQHHAMAMAALRAGAHLYVEKPFTQTLAEADELLALAEPAGTRIAVAHQVRLAPNILFLKQRLDDGLIGELLEIRAHSKQDHRAGGEELIVLGVHTFDLMRFFAGDPLWCTASVSQQGKEIAVHNIHSATENIGPIVGDEIIAQFAFSQNVHASFTSRAKNRQSAGPPAIELIGTKGSVKILPAIFPTIMERNTGGALTAGQPSEWRPLQNDPAADLPGEEKSVLAANRRVVDDWLAAIEEKRQPICSGEAGMKALEMALAVFAAGLSKQRVYFPMKQRNHPLRQTP